MDERQKERIQELYTLLKAERDRAQSGVLLLAKELNDEELETFVLVNGIERNQTDTYYEMSCVTLDDALWYLLENGEPPKIS